MRNVFLRYPDTAIRNIRGEMPPLLGNLLQTAWTLHGIDDESFDADMTLHILRFNSFQDWVSIYPQTVLVTDDPLGNIQSLIDIYEEVHVAADLIAQDMAAAMDALVSPHTVVAPIVMSTAEQIRILCALLTVKMYYLFRRKFAQKGHSNRNNFPLYFMRAMEPWQAEQAKSIIRVACSIDKLWAFYLHETINTQSKNYEYFQNLAYFQSHVDDWSVGSETISLFSGAARRCHDEDGQLPFWMMGSTDEWPVPDASPHTPQLPSHGWMVFASISGTSTLHRSCLGLMFWDYSRLISWNLIDVEDLVALDALVDGLETAYRSRSYTLMPVWERRSPSPLFALRPLEYNKRRETRQIIRWTRSSVQKSLEEFLQEETRPARILSGYQPVPVKYTKAGVRCYYCGLEGHCRIRCGEKTWSDADG